jgi:dihydrofolate synthase/folylpolyglutamate synthase
LTSGFVIGGRPIDHAALFAAVADVRAAIDALTDAGVLAVQPTFFEVTTAVAFEIFKRARVEVAVLEVGMGGRLDATNVVSPTVTAITTIAFDHQRYLGATLREIALEKAGIIKPGVPVVVGDLPDEAGRAIEAVAHDRGAELIPAPAKHLGDITIGLEGAHQRANAAVAVAVLQALDARGIRVPPSAIETGLAHPHWPGRLDLRRLPDGREALLDAAHNPAGAAALASYLSDLARDESGGARRPLVFAAMRDKDVVGMFTALLPVVGDVVVTRASTARSESPDELAAIVRRLSPDREVIVESNPAGALDRAWRSAPRIVVAGSIFLLGDVLKLIGAP